MDIVEFLDLNTLTACPFYDNKVSTCGKKRQVGRAGRRDLGECEELRWPPSNHHVIPTGIDIINIHLKLDCKDRSVEFVTASGIFRV
jgi:hypothetical protein